MQFIFIRFNSLYLSKSTISSGGSTFNFDSREFQGVQNQGISILKKFKLKDFIYCTQYI